jgi:amino acid transporter
MSTEPTPVADDRVVRDANIKFGITKWDIWALGITIVIGGQYFSWNAGLTSGFGSYFVSTILMGTAYICLCLSVSEITSALPFAGGAYGLARCSLGFFPGFVIGCSETVEYIFYVSSSTVSLGQMFTTMFPDLIGYEPYIWLAFYLSALSIHIFGGKYFWRFTMITAVASILPLMIFVFGSLKWSNIQKYGESTEDTPLFIGGISQFLTSFPLPAWFYVGVESLNMASNDIDQPKLTIPFGQITCILTLFCFSILVLSVASGLPPGLADLAGNPFPLNTGNS